MKESFDAPPQSIVALLKASVSEMEMNDVIKAVCKTVFEVKSLERKAT